MDYFIRCVSYFITISEWPVFAPLHSCSCLYVDKALVSICLQNLEAECDVDLKNNCSIPLAEAGA